MAGFTANSNFSTDALDCNELALDPELNRRGREKLPVLSQEGVIAPCHLLGFEKNMK